MDKKKYYYVGLSASLLFFLFWGYLSYREPKPNRFIASVASLHNDGCISEMKVFKDQIPVSTCQLEGQIEEETDLIPLNDVEITHFKRKRFHFNLEDYIDKIQKAELRFSSTYKNEKITLKCKAVLQVFNMQKTTTLSLDECNNEHISRPFDLFFVYKGSGF